jgi:hypothetical protein
MIPSILISIGKRIAGLALGGAVLWQVAIHAGPSQGSAVIHVTTLPAVLRVDDQEYRLERTTPQPVVCDLHAGGHTMQLVRKEQIVFEENFTLQPGEDIVLTAWDPSRKQREIEMAKASLSKQLSGNAPTQPALAQHRQP